MHTSLESIYNLYRPGYTNVLVRGLKQHKYNLGGYTEWYWKTNNFSTSSVKAAKLSRFDKALAGVLAVAVLVQLVLGVLFIIGDTKGEVVGGLWFGLAFIVATPVIAAMLLPLVYFALSFFLILRRKK